MYVSICEWLRKSYFKKQKWYKKEALNGKFLMYEKFAGIGVWRIKGYEKFS